jgi:hypothetical protein
MKYLILLSNQAKRHWSVSMPSLLFKACEGVQSGKFHRGNLRELPNVVRILLLIGFQIWIPSSEYHPDRQWTTFPRPVFSNRFQMHSLFRSVAMPIRTLSNYKSTDTSNYSNPKKNREVA